MRSFLKYCFREDCNMIEATEPLVEQNVFKKERIHIGFLPRFSRVRGELPVPFWEGHEEYIKAYWYAWKIAFKNIKNPVPFSRFKRQYIDTAFNGCLFMWDSSFIMMFGKYGVGGFNFQQTLDNFYACQHKDGFISREIIEGRNGEHFDSYDPISTGPNILPWAEWEYYKNTGDKERLQKVFAPLLAYHKWLHLHRTWRDGLYWNTGLGCGMDNMPRLPKGYNVGVSHGHMVWIDTNCQMIISAKILIEISKIIGKETETEYLKKEINHLTKFINEKMWSEEDGFYYDLWTDEDGKESLGTTKGIGAYWALLADIIPKDRIERFVSHLQNEKEFNRPNRVPTLSADHPDYKEDGGYWHGSVWAPTNYMVIRGLQKYGYFDLAEEIASCTLKNVIEVYNKTKTLWENYAPEYAGKGNPAKDKFVGWSGLFPITMLLEGIFGLEADAQNDRVIWRIAKNIGSHGVQKYPLSSGTCDLFCAFQDGKPVVTIQADFPVEADVWYQGKFLYTVQNH